MDSLPRRLARRLGLDRICLQAYIDTVPVKRRYSFFISDDLYEGLKALKERDGVPEAESIRRAIGEYLTNKRIVLQDKTERQRRLTRRRS